MRKIKTLISLAILLLLANIVISQNTVENNNPKKSNFYEIQKNFNNYCKENNIVKGKITIDGKTRKAPGYKQYKRWEWFWEQRVDSLGNFPKSNIVWEEWKKQKNNNSQTTKSNNIWKARGPYEKSIQGLGRINCLEFHPTDTNTMWIGASGGGMWKTIDGGTSWAPITDSLPTLGISSIVVNPNNPNIMYISTGDGEAVIGGLYWPFGNTNHGNSQSIGILKSTDGGSSWVNIYSVNQEDDAAFNKIIINKVNPSILYIASSVGILKTTDAGNNWSILEAGNFIDIIFNPNSYDTIYASTYERYGNAQIYTSTDGVSFTLKKTFSDVERIAMAVSPKNPNTITIATSNKTYHNLDGIYKSFDIGNTWTKIYDGSIYGNNLLGGMSDGTSPDGQGWYDIEIITSPIDSNLLYFGGISTYKSIDGGYNWQNETCWTDHASINMSGTQVVHADKHYFAFHPLNNNTLFECNDGGIFKIELPDTLWQDITNRIQISELYSICNAQTDSSAFMGGRQDNGTFAILNNTEIHLNYGDGMKTAIDYSNGNYIYSSMQNGAITKHIVSTQSYSIISDSIPGNPEGAWLTPYLLDPVNPENIVAGYKQVYKSYDRGDSWTNISNFFNNTVPINYLDIAPTNTNYIYISFQKKILFTPDNGNSWQIITGSLPTNFNISAIKVDPTNENKLYVTKSGFTADKKVFYTTDNGANWTNITGSGLPNLPTYCIEIDKSSGDIYLGTEIGVYLFNNSDTTWSKYGSSLPNVLATDLDIQYSGSLLRVGTFGRGVWQIPLNTTYVPTLTSSFSSDATTICKNGCINFYDNSVNPATSWSWTFTGATPSSSSQKNPTNICYSDTGSFSVSLTVTNTISNDSKTITDYVKVMDCTSINEVENDKYVKIFPNPNNGSFSIEMSNSKGFKEVNIYNLIGELVYTNSKLQKQYKITELPKGTYMVEIVYSNKKITKKVLVM